jgi:hypothetical protein
MLCLTMLCCESREQVGCFLDDDLYIRCRPNLFQELGESGPQRAVAEVDARFFSCGTLTLASCPAHLMSDLPVGWSWSTSTNHYQ